MKKKPPLHPKIVKIGKVLCLPSDRISISAGEGDVSVQAVCGPLGVYSVSLSGKELIVIPVDPNSLSLLTQMLWR